MSVNADKPKADGAVESNSEQVVSGAVNEGTTTAAFTDKGTEKELVQTTTGEEVRTYNTFDGGFKADYLVPSPGEVSNFQKQEELLLEANGKFSTPEIPAVTDDEYRLALYAAKPKRPFIDTGTILLQISIWTYVGVIIRYYLTIVSKEYTLYPALNVYLAELVGAWIMAIVFEHRSDIDRKSLSLYIGLGTGLCGSITTFASFMENAADVYIQFNPTGSPNNAATRVIGTLCLLVSGIVVSLGGLCAGYHFSLLVSPSVRKRKRKQYNLLSQEDEEGIRETTNNKEKRRAKLKVHRAGIKEFWMTVISFVLITAFIVLMTYFLNNYDLLLACLFGPFGSILRYYLSALNREQFPYGTFAANMVGSAVEGIAIVISLVYNVDTLWETAVLAGVKTGFCGCCSTISTFVVELRALVLKSQDTRFPFEAYGYGLVSIIVGQLCYILTVGVYVWSR